MDFSKTWDVDKYKSEFESEEHWALRKKFMETHKDKFPEDKLVCLARVFFNIEFLGCRYPEKTMKLVAELSQGVADEHREKQKGKLKRTFVQASDAAGAKIKRGLPPVIEPPQKVLETEEGKPNKAFQYSCFVKAESVKPLSPLESGPFPGFILFENCNVNGKIEDCPVNILTHSSDKSLQWKPIFFYFPPEQNKIQSEKYCQLKLNNKLLSSGSGISAKEAKLNAAREGLRILRQTCYTIQAKNKFFSDTIALSKTGVLVKEEEKPLSQDNIGSRMMQRMGWTGSGLGKNKQGIQEPVKATSQIMQRSGFGNFNQKEFHAKFRKILMDYAASDSENDLVFASDFSSDERKVLHKLAQNYKLKTHSYGKDNDRHLVVNKVLPLPVIVRILLENNGENDKYKLIHPTGETDSSESRVIKEPTVPASSKEESNLSSMLPNTNAHLRIPVNKTDNESTMSAENISLSTKTSEQSEFYHLPQEIQTEMASIEGVGPSSSAPMEDGSENISEPSNFTLDGIEGISDGYFMIDEELEREINGIEYCDNNIDESNDDGTSFIDSVLRERQSSIQQMGKIYKQLIEIYKKNKQFTKNERKQYIYNRKLLITRTGIHLQNIVNPELTIEDILSGKKTATQRVLKNIKKRETLNMQYKFEALGALLTGKDPMLKNMICKRLETQPTKEMVQKKIRRFVRKQFQHIGHKYLMKSDKLDELKDKIKCLDKFITGANKSDNKSAKSGTSKSPNTSTCSTNKKSIIVQKNTKKQTKTKQTKKIKKKKCEKSKVKQIKFVKAKNSNANNTL